MITQRTGFLDKFEREWAQAYEKGDFVKADAARKRYLATIYAMGYDTEEGYNAKLLKDIDEGWSLIQPIRRIILN